MTALRVLREEFRIQNIWLNHEHHAAFISCQWKWPCFIFIIYRLVFALYTIGAFIQYVIALGDYNRYAEQNNLPHHNVMVFLTTWSYIVLTVHFNFSFLCLILDKCETMKSSKSETSTQLEDNAGIRNLGFKSEEEIAKETNISATDSNMSANTEYHPDDVVNNKIHRSLPWYSKTSWFFANISSVWSLVVTIIYYGALFRGDEFKIHDVHVHMMNSVFMLIDTAICARPVKILHVIYPLVYGVVYTIFSVIYWSFDKENNVIYSVVLDWNYPGTTIGVLTGLTVVVIPLFQIIFFGLYHLRLVCFRKIYNHNYN